MRGEAEVARNHRQALASDFWPGLVLGIAVAAGCIAGILTRPTGMLATIWPANALMLGVLIRFPRTNTLLGWTFATVGFMAADFATGSTLLRSLLLNGANLLGVGAGLMVSSRLPRAVQRLNAPSSMLYLVAVSCVAAAAAGCVGAVANPILFGGGSLEGWEFWFVTELVNYIALLPVILAFPGLRRELTIRLRPVDVAPLAALVALCGLSVMVGGGGAIAFPVPALFWCALVYTPFVTAVLTLTFGGWTLLAISGGYLPVYGDPNDPFSLVSVRLGVSLIAIAPQMLSSVMASRNELLRRLRTMATEDSLTSVFNRAGFLAAARGLLSSSRGPCAVIMLDVDHFKGVNDRYGHAAGDEVLIALARRISNALRAGDVFGRLGGEEFAVVTMPCSRDDAEVLAERLRSCIDSAPVIVPDGTLVSVTISLGYAYGISDPDTLERFMAEADKALYAAKAAGRNRTMGAAVQPVEAPSAMVVPFGRNSSAS